MSTNCFAFKIRTQFSFIVDDNTLSCILSGIAKQGINITGYFQTKLFKSKDDCHKKNNNNIVKLVVGDVDCENIKDLNGVRKVLDYLGVDFHENSVIQVIQITPGTTGLFNDIFGALWCKLTVNAIYVGEENTFFIDVSDLCKALKILSQTPLKQCPKHCCPCCSED